MERKRNHNFVIRLTEEEKLKLDQKVKNAGLANREAYCRAMILNGVTINVSLSEVQELVRLLSNATNNINQIARKANETNSIYESDIAAVREALLPIWDDLRMLTKALLAVKKQLG